jgi:GGDEF domain-containing protein
MHVFDRIDPTNLDRREVHLWLLAFTIIFVLVVGMALLMYPTVFATPVVLSGQVQRKAFFGFCALAVLVLGYLIDRQVMIANLRRQLARERETVIRIRHEESEDLLKTLPGFAHFQDRLAMEYRRAATTQQSLSLVLVVLKSARDLSDLVEVSTAFGDAAKALMRKLRGEDSIYLFNPGVFCIVLPGVTAKNAYLVADRLTEGLQDASGASGRFLFQIQVFNYPEHAKSAREIEEAVRPFVPKQSPGISVEEVAATPTSTP